MTRGRGAPRLTEREDPLSFILRNRPAREVLERLQGQPLMIPITVRKSVGVHPEAFRRLVGDLNEFALISIRPFPRERLQGRRSRGLLQVPIGIELTRTGENLLEITREVRKSVSR